MGTHYDFDLIVIGGGIAGFVSAVTANGLGKRVAIVEKRKIGGNCTNFTCIPSKALIRAGHVARELAHLDHFGLQTSPEIVLDTHHVMARIRSVVQKAYEKDLPETFEEIGITVIPGRAAFTNRHTVGVDGTILTADKFIVATGTRPFIPPITGLQEIDYLTNENLYELDGLPKSLIVLGGGVDGLEYASAFGRLGLETTVVEMATRLLPMVDCELANGLLKTLRTEGITVLAGAKARRVWKEKGRVVLMFEESDGRLGEVQADRMLVSIGRRPDLEGLDLKKADIEYTPRGIVTDATLRTSAPNIYACGDVVGPFQLASTAEYQGTVAATNAVLPIKRRVDYKNNAYVIFTEPPIAYMGLTEEEAHREYGHKLRVYRFDYRNMRRAMVDGEQSGVAKFLCDENGGLLGVHIFGEGAPEVIHEVQAIKAFHKPLHALRAATHAYPTYAQALVGRASQLAYLDKMRGNPLVRTVLKLLPGCANRLGLARERLAETPQTPSVAAKVTAAATIDVEAYGRGKACVLHLPPDLLDHDEAPLLEALSSKISKGSPHVILDFGKVRRINGLGTSMLVKFWTRSRRDERLVSACGVTPGLRDVLQVTELNQAIRVHSSRDEALSAAGIFLEHGPAGDQDEANGTVETPYWAKPVTRLEVSHNPKEARCLNVNGRCVKSAVNGFGQLWQKVFRLHISDPAITPEQAIASLKENFPGFQLSYNRFFPSPAGIQPGEIVLFDSLTPAGPISTGVMILYADERSFTFISPQGHPECGTVSFSAYEVEDATVVQVVGLARASDPLYEGGFRAVGSRVQTRVWTHVLTSLATYLGVPATITTEATCVDRHTRWSQVGNMWYNAQIRTLIREPIWWLTAPTRRGSGKKANRT
jgi:pyruvate/2-oxoglutarate dehydrogenase complex dihydrolipoamide dehydrogenase (E3) component/anti-anti-sigma regulatory factor